MKYGRILPEMNGKIFTDVRDMDLENIPGYDVFETFLRFLDKYAMLNLGERTVTDYMRKNRNKTLVDLLTVADVAFTILNYENDKECWSDFYCRKNSTQQDVRIAAPKYHAKRGAKIAKFGSGWTDEGRAYYTQIVGEIKRLWESEAFMSVLRQHWRDYLAKNHRSYYKRKRAEIEEDESENDEDDGSNDCDCEIDL